jgi:hypothetical protein
MIKSKEKYGKSDKSGDYKGLFSKTRGGKKKRL